MDSNDLLIEFLKRSVLKSAALEKAMREAPRELFVPKRLAREAYEDYPLPIGQGQTISQPWTVVFMTEMLDVKEGMKVLEVGAGSGWQAAILGKMVGPNGRVFALEINGKLAALARKNLKKAGVENVLVKKGDGTMGLPKEKPFDRIMIAAASPGVPKPLEEQLKRGGKLVAPVDSPPGQVMTLYEKTENGLEAGSSQGFFRFVPLKGRHGLRLLSGGNP